MPLKFYMYPLLLSFFLVSFGDISAYDNAIIMPSYFHDVMMKVVKFFMGSQDVKQDDIILQSSDTVGKAFGNDGSASQKQDEKKQDETLLFSRLEKAFIDETYWDELREFEWRFSRESEKNYNLFVQRVTGIEYHEWIARMSVKHLVESLISIKYNAIINTLLVMKNTEQNKEKFGVFNEIFDFIEKNKKFGFDEKKEMQLVNKIKEVMNEAHHKSIENGEPDEFEEIFLSYGMSKEKSILWQKFCDQYRCDYAKRNFESLICMSTSTFDLK